MAKNIQVFLGDIRIGAYTEENTLGIDPQAAVAALRHILFEKTPTLSVDAETATATVSADKDCYIVGDDSNAQIRAVRIMTTLGVEIESHYSE